MGGTRRKRKQQPVPDLSEFLHHSPAVPGGKKGDGVRKRKRALHEARSGATAAAAAAPPPPPPSSSSLPLSARNLFDGSSDEEAGGDLTGKVARLNASDRSDDDDDGSSSEFYGFDHERGSEDQTFVTAASSEPESSGLQGDVDMLSEEDDEFVHRDNDVFSDDDLSDEKLSLANLEGLSLKLDAKIAADKLEAEKELTQQIVPDRPEVLPHKSTVTDKLGEEIAMPEDLAVVQTRIQEVTRVLADFANLGETTRSRSEYIEQLITDLATYYAYNQYLAVKLFNLFSPLEAVSFFEANEVPRPVTIRVNTLKTTRRNLAQSLMNRGVNLAPVPGKWSKHGLQVFDSAVPIGATPEYLAGHYILQSVSSFLPVLALDPKPDERILDMASAPGGKVTYISALMNNTGVIFANDSGKQSRIKALCGNVSRLGCENVVVLGLDGRDFPKAIGGFDRVLLDAPCSGTGVINKDASVKTSKTAQDFVRLSHLQKQLILSAIDSVVAGGTVVYSTCSITVEENEQIVAYALRKRPHVRIVDTGLMIGCNGYTRLGTLTWSPEMAKTKRFWPHVHNMDGFYVAKFFVAKKHKTKDGSIKTESLLD